ncbi:MAG: N-acetylmuramoyl-L-alanine amidase [Verrucomicrobiaceae bacterium]|nr:N-acetylmuramoyl-L-alanine amidase [Verrucomicrobiaceae bacterium]
MKFRRTALLLAQVLASFAALAGACLALVWLENSVTSLPRPTLPPSAGEMQKTPLVLVDAGHGGHDGGAVAHGSIEKHLTLEIARRLRTHLEAAGLRVVMTREKDEFLPLDTRAALTARHGAAAFVSIHINTDGSGTAAEGIETYFAAKPSLSAIRQTGGKAAKRPASEDLAAQVQKHVCEATRAENRGIKDRGYVVISQAACPAVLVECGFLTNSAEAARLKDATHQEKLAQGIATGVKRFLQSRPAGSVVLAAK